MTAGRRRLRLLDPPTAARPGPVVSAPSAAVTVALYLADGDHRRLHLEPAPGALGGVRVVVRNRPRWSR